MLQELGALFFQFIDIILHLDLHLNQWIAMFGPWIYVILFLIVFCETGLVVFPFLPGDSLLFALGALTTVDNAFLNMPLMILSLTVAAILGDALNYSIGRYLGPKIFFQETGWLLNKEHLVRTQNFYARYGGKVIIFARFAPIFRTFAPFVAGIGRMNYSRFATYNVVGAIAWVPVFLYLGHFFGQTPYVKKNFHVVILAIVVISFIPAVVEFWKARRQSALAK